MEASYTIIFIVNDNTVVIIFEILEIHRTGCKQMCYHIDKIGTKNDLNWWNAMYIW